MWRVVLRVTLCNGKETNQLQPVQVISVQLRTYFKGKSAMKRSALAVASVFSMVILSGIAASPCRAIELLHYPFDQVDGTEAPFTTPDATGRGNTGTLVSMDNTSPVPGRVGNALQFSGTTTTAPRDRVQNGTDVDASYPVGVTTDTNRTYTQFTFAAFVKPDLDEALNTTAFIAGKQGNSPKRGWQIGYQLATATNDHQIVVSIFDNPGPPNAEQEILSGAGNSLTNGTWHHVAFTFSGTNEATSFFRLYLDGNRIVDAPATLTQLNGVNLEPFQVGNRGDQRADSWKGLIDDVHIFDTALTDAEIAALIPPIPPAQVGDFNENGKVDGADYALWRKNIDGLTALPNDNGLGTPIGTAHYDLWRANFGNPPGSGAGSLSDAAVPEPTAALLAIAAAVMAAGGGRLRRCR
jgi:hypothetical protein